MPAKFTQLEITWLAVMSRAPPIWNPVPTTDPPPLGAHLTTETAPLARLMTLFGTGPVADVVMDRVDAPAAGKTTLLAILVALLLEAHGAQTTSAPATSTASVE